MHTHDEMPFNRPELEVNASLLAKKIKGLALKGKTFQFSSYVLNEEGTHDYSVNLLVCAKKKYLMNVQEYKFKWTGLQNWDGEPELLTDWKILAEIDSLKGY